MIITLIIAVKIIHPLSKLFSITNIKFVKCDIHVP